MPASAEILALPPFRSYTAGAPSDTLYLKNLAADITLADLEAVFQHVTYVFTSTVCTAPPTVVSDGINLARCACAAWTGRSRSS